MGSDQQFCLRWHNYQSSLLASLPQLLDGDDLTDVTLSAGGRNLRAHRVVLSACSQYFKELFKVLQPLQHPVIVLPGTNFTDLCALVTFMYSGEVNIYQEQLPGLLNMADAMQIRGLAEVNGSAGKLGNNETAPSPKKETMSSAKRAKMSTHASVGPLLANQSPAADAKLPQTETVDIHGHFLKGKVSEYEIYGGTASRTTKQLNIENDLHYGNLQKESCPKTMAMSDSMDLYVENIPSKKSARGTVTKTEPEEGMRRSSPIMGLSTNIDNSTVGGNRVKIERDHNEGTGNTRISPDLAAVLKRATGIEDMELGSVENSAVQGLSLTGCPSTPPSRQSVACPVCGRLISQRRNLSQHMRTHQMVLSDVNNHAEPAQVSVLPLDHVQARYGSRSRTTINHQTRPQHSMEEVVAPESSAGESIHGTVGMLSLDPSSQPHYS
ncbi:protein tramtrack, beta isoform-like isoform X3 [Periplaneta americana]|uniref:protein tramtrack, beta isoform-like isoform X3 n=1 Tax=Periplaneta americana TaxID=6978 RepID=UPI0037E7BDC1